MKNDKQQRHRRLFHDKFEQIERCVAAAATRPNTYLPKIASLRYDLASNCWFDDQDGVTAEEQLLAAIDACDRYTGRRSDVATMRISAIEALTFIYNQLGRLEDSERMMLLQLEAERERAAQNEEVYLENVALQLWHLGNLYVDMHRDKDAEAVYLEHWSCAHASTTRTYTATAPQRHNATAVWATYIFQDWATPTRPKPTTRRL